MPSCIIGCQTCHSSSACCVVCPFPLVTCTGSFSHVITYWKPVKRLPLVQILWSLCCCDCMPHYCLQLMCMLLDTRKCTWCLWSGSLTFSLAHLPSLCMPLQINFQEINFPMCGTFFHFFFRHFRALICEFIQPDNSQLSYDPLTYKLTRLCCTTKTPVSSYYSLCEVLCTEWKEYTVSGSFTFCSGIYYLLFATGPCSLMFDNGANICTAVMLMSCLAENMGQ